MKGQGETKTGAMPGLEQGLYPPGRNEVTLRKI
jgi:hypothetical protein